MGLTYKRRMFVANYLGACEGNATEAARKAGYATPMQEGARLLTDPDVRALIDAQVAEAGLESDEILARLADQASSNAVDLIRCVVDDVVEIGGEKVARQRIDPDEIERRGLGHLIKKITPNRYGYVIELYDAQRALELLGRFRGLFADRIKIEGKLDFDKMTDDELRTIANGKKPAHWR